MKVFILLIWELSDNAKLNMNIKNIFSNAITRAYKRLDDGKEITVSPKSDRYTYDNQEDTNYDKNWKPETAEERKTLSPSGYFRKGETESVKEERGINKDNEDLYNKKQISIPSTAISKINYDPDTEGLTVQFQGENKKYFYPGVPLELVQSLMKAPSKGEFFMANIHDQYTMNPGHRPVGQSKTYGEMTKRAVGKFFKKYKKAYKKNNKGKWSE